MTNSSGKGRIFKSILKEKERALAPAKKKAEDEKRQLQSAKDLILDQVAGLQRWFEQLLIEEPEFKEYLDKLAERRFRLLGYYSVIAEIYSEKYEEIKNGKDVERYYIEVKLGYIPREYGGYKYRLGLYHTYQSPDFDDSEGSVDIFDLAKGHDFNQNMTELNRLLGALKPAVARAKDAKRLMKEVVNKNHRILSD